MAIFMVKLASFIGEVQEENVSVRGSKRAMTPRTVHNKCDVYLNTKQLRDTFQDYELSRKQNYPTLYY